MKHFILCLLLLPFSTIAMHQAFAIENRSDQDITVYYIRPQGILAYTILSPNAVEQLPILMPQMMTIHFNDQDKQRSIQLAIDDKQLIIHQLNKMQTNKHTPPLPVRTASSAGSRKTR